jgi:myo-inositol catabolism protein IolC
VNGGAGDLYVLAFDHRRSLMTSFFGVRGEPSWTDRQRARDVKRLIWLGLQRALPSVAPPDAAGALVDLTYGEDVAREARAGGLSVAVPIEESGRAEFAFEREDWATVVDEIDPTWVKVLVRYNPGGDAAMNQRQRSTLASVSRSVRRTGRGLMFELLVPPEADQLERVSGDVARYDSEVRPELMARSIDELLAASVEPDVWKIEGIDRPEHCEEVAAHARARGREHVRCVVLGRGSDTAAVDGWLRAAAGVPGFAGFAIGRSIWWDAAHAYMVSRRGPVTDHTHNAAIDTASASIAERYLRFIDVYTGRA